MKHLLRSLLEPPGSNRLTLKVLQGIGAAGPLRFALRMHIRKNAEYQWRDCRLGQG